MKIWLKEQLSVTRRVLRLMAVLAGVVLCWPILAAVDTFGWTGFNDVAIGPNPQNSNSIGCIVFSTTGPQSGVPTRVGTSPGIELQASTKLRINANATMDNYGTSTLKSGGEINENSGGLHIVGLSPVSLTSPTVTFPAVGLYGIELTANANLTGVHPTGGRTGQLLMITTGSGSNTIGFTDDATSMTIGGNITLTESQNDFLTLRCVQAPAASNGYGQWAAVSAHDN